VRIVGQLLDARTGEELWSETYDRELKDIFVLQSEVSRKIALALRGELSSADAVLLKPDRAQDFDAYNLYLKGRYNWSTRSEEGFNRSVQYFHEAIARSPNYAPAYAGLADAYTLLGVYGILPRLETESRAFAAATKAIELDDSLAEAHASLGYIQKNQFHWSQAEESFKRAIALKPGYVAAHHWYASYLAQVGRLPEAIVEIKTALSLDPLSTSVNAEFGAVLILARRYDEAIAQIQRTLEMDPSASRVHLMLAEAHAYVGAYDQALEELTKALQSGTLGAEDQELVSVKGYVLAMAGRRAEALTIVSGLAERYRQHREAVAGGIAIIYAALGDKTRAFSWLATAVESHDSEISYLKVDRRLDPLRSDPRFERILTQLGLSS
jgi:tetratricopeptide (TPR) repeat protein